MRPDSEDDQGNRRHDGGHEVDRADYREALGDRSGAEEERRGMPKTM